MRGMGPLGYILEVGLVGLAGELDARWWGKEESGMSHRCEPCPTIGGQGVIVSL